MCSAQPGNQRSRMKLCEGATSIGLLFLRPARPGPACRGLYRNSRSGVVSKLRSHPSAASDSAGASGLAACPRLAGWSPPDWLHISGDQRPGPLPPPRRSSQLRVRVRWVFSARTRRPAAFKNRQVSAEHLKLTQLQLKEKRNT